MDLNTLIQELERLISGNKDTSSNSLTFNGSTSYRDIPDYEPTGCINFSDKDIKYKILEGDRNQIRLLCQDAFAATDLQNHVRSKGY